MNETSRLTSIDRMRGLIIALMALDHASFFVAKVHASEYWGVSLPVYPDAFSFVTRLVTHLCAPGFFFLMGIGMTLFAVRRREVGFTQARIRRHFLVRGLALVVIQQVLENPAWFLGFLAGPVASYGAAIPPGSGGLMPYFMFTVLFGLGGAMMAGGFALELPSPVVIALCLGSVVATALLTPDVSQVRVAQSPATLLLMVSGMAGRWIVLYPIVPWLAPMLLGLVFGRVLVRDGPAAMRLALRLGLVLLVAFVVFRSLRGVGNLHGDFGGGWIDFLNTTKYPPSTVFLLFTLGVDLLLLAGLARLADTAALAPLLAFGRAPLFFYLAHLWVLEYRHVCVFFHKHRMIQIFLVSK